MQDKAKQGGCCKQTVRMVKFTAVDTVHSGSMEVLRLCRGTRQYKSRNKEYEVVVFMKREREGGGTAPGGLFIDAASDSAQALGAFDSHLEESASAFALESGGQMQSSAIEFRNYCGSQRILANYPYGI